MEKNKSKKKKSWMKFRHRVIFPIARFVLWPYTRWKYGVKVERFRQQGDRPYLILMNHQTVFDQFFVGMAFRGPVYFIATEDIFSLGWVSSLIRYLVAPIPIKKQTTDLTAVMTCLRVAREGGTIALAPEGNRTYSGRTEYMNPAIASLAKKLKLPIALFRIEGGYGVQPRWSDVIRKGSMRAYVSQVIEPEEVAVLTQEELMERICTGLMVEEAAPGGLFRHQNRAEYLERAIYVCPFCGLAEWESHGHTVTCKRCGRTITYGEDKRLQGVGFDFPFPYVGQWYDYQQDFVNSLDLSQYTAVPIFQDQAALSQVHLYQRKEPLRETAAFALYGDRVVVDGGTERELSLPFAEVTAMSVLGRNKLNIYHGGLVYQVKGSKRFNALKYVNLYYRYKNISTGNPDEKFLGL